MTKPGAPIPLAPKTKAPRPSVSEGTDTGPKKKKRRQSAPAKQGPNGSKRRDVAAFRSNLKAATFEEDVIAEEQG